MLKEYQKVALERLNPSAAGKDKESMRFCCMGMIEEAGEIASELRKPLFKGNYHEKELDKKAIESEMGDLIWYIALACRNNDVDIEDIEKQEKMEKTDDIKRDELIKRGIRIGQASAKTTRAYLELYKGKVKKGKFTKEIGKLYRQILKLSIQLNIPMSEILKTNLQKVNSRYNLDGSVNNKDEGSR